jgi:hypothetical protein
MEVFDMSRMTRRTILGVGLLLVPGLLAPATLGQEKKEVQPGQPVVINVTTAVPAPDVSLALGKREAKVSPCRVGCTHTGGGNVDVQQPSPDTLVVTMTGATVAYGSPAGAASASLDFTLSQAFEVSFDKPTVKAAKLTMEGRVIGFLRSHKLGTAEESGSAVVGGAAGGPGLTLAVPSHAVTAGESASLNDKEGPVSLIVPAAGPLCLTQTFRVAASMPRSVLPCKAPSAEFAPDPALDPLWISAKEPFHGAAKKDLGFQVVIKVTPAESPEVKNGKK